MHPTKELPYTNYIKRAGRYKHLRLTIRIFAYEYLYDALELILSKIGKSNLGADPESRTRNLRFTKALLCH